jgi:hypothetical protein
MRKILDISYADLSLPLKSLSLQSEKLNKTILPESDQFYSTSRAMRKILDISYADLSLPLKSCFLYLAAFSENHDIKKDRLIHRWVAEGLIPERRGKSSWETGESYFGELISRRLIQPAFDDSDDQPIGCTVHSVVFDFLESLSSEENFVTPGAELKSGLLPCERVRRVSQLDFGDEDEGDTVISNTYCLLEQKCQVTSSCEEDEEGIFSHLSRVRSLAFCGMAVGSLIFQPSNICGCWILRTQRTWRTNSWKALGVCLC